MPYQIKAAVAVPVTGNCADLPEVIVRTECSCSLKMLLRANAVRTSPENTFRNRASKSVPLLFTSPSLLTVALANGFLL